MPSDACGDEYLVRAYEKAGREKPGSLCSSGRHGQPGWQTKGLSEEGTLLQPEDLHRTEWQNLGNRWGRLEVPGPLWLSGAGVCTLCRRIAQLPTLSVYE